MVADERDDDMFTPLIPIKIDSIYDRFLIAWRSARPVRMRAFSN